MNKAEPIPYKEAFPVGTRVRVADHAFLDEFKETWKFHHKLQPEQFSYADRTTVVQKVGFYHGGDPVYTLADIPGLWLEQCLGAGPCAIETQAAPSRRDFRRVGHDAVWVR
jgi:hypothetical protein